MYMIFLAIGEPMANPRGLVLMQGIAVPDFKFHCPTPDEFRNPCDALELLHMLLLCISSPFLNPPIFDNTQLLLGSLMSYPEKTLVDLPITPQTA